MAQLDGPRGRGFSQPPQSGQEQPEGRAGFYTSPCSESGFRAFWRPSGNASVGPCKGQIGVRMGQLVTDFLSASPNTECLLSPAHAWNVNRKFPSKALQRGSPTRGAPEAPSNSSWPRPGVETWSSCLCRSQTGWHYWYLEPPLLSAKEERLWVLKAVWHAGQLWIRLGCSEMLPGCCRGGGGWPRAGRKEEVQVRIRELQTIMSREPGSRWIKIP